MSVAPPPGGPPDMADDFTGTNSDKIDRLVVAVTDLRSTVRWFKWLASIALPSALAATGFLASMIHQNGLRLERLTEKVEQHDRRFDQVDKRFDLVDKRMDLLEKRMDALDKRMDGLEKKQQETNDRLTRVEDALKQIAAKLDRLPAK